MKFYVCERYKEGASAFPAGTFQDRVTANNKEWTSAEHCLKELLGRWGIFPICILFLYPLNYVAIHGLVTRPRHYDAGSMLPISKFAPFL